jgi:hypothetical protein
MLLHLIAAHLLLVRVVVALVVAAMVFAVLLVAAGYRPRHRGAARALRSGHAPRHARTRLARRAPRHSAAAAGPATVLGRTPDGDITLVHADPPAVRLADVPTVETRALAGVAA